MTDEKRVSKPLAFGKSVDNLSENDNSQGVIKEKESEDIEIHTISRDDKIENGDLSLDQTIKKLVSPKKIFLFDSCFNHFFIIVFQIKCCLL